MCFLGDEMLLTASTYLHADPALRNSSRSLAEERTETRDNGDVVTTRVYKDSENQIVAVAVAVRFGKPAVRSFFLSAFVMLPVYIIAILLSLLGLMDMSLFDFVLWFLLGALLSGMLACLNLRIKKAWEKSWTKKKAQAILNEELGSA
jgi:uncharacterized membrane protein YcaP (DUF421 family)